MGFHLPVYGILSDGNTFEFFRFDGTAEPYTCKYGIGPNDPPTCWQPFRLPGPGETLTTQPFIDALRPICEVIFDLLLSGYVSSLKVQHDHFIIKKARKGQLKRNESGWEEAMCAAISALNGFRHAEKKRQTQLIDEADLIVEKAMTFLKCRYEISIFSNIMFNCL